MNEKEFIRLIAVLGLVVVGCIGLISRCVVDLERAEQATKAAAAAEKACADERD